MDYSEDHVGYRAIPIEGAAPGQNFGIATPRDIRLPQIVKAFIDSCVDLQQRGAFDRLTVWQDGHRTPKN